MWDILFFSSSELSLALRRGRNDFLYSFPWSEPVGSMSWDVERPEMINVPARDLFTALCVRAKVDAFARTAQMARVNLNGKIPRNLDELQNNALKFGFKRFHQKKSSAEEFLDDLRCCAILKPIPESFWPALGAHVRPERLQKLKRQMGVLERFHRDEAFWLEHAVTYMARTLWSQDEFQMIIYAASQLAISYPASEIKPQLAELSQRAQGVMKAKEIQQTMATVKPWQKTTPTMKKSIRVGPRSGRPKRDGAKTEGSEGDDGENK